MKQQPVKHFENHGFRNSVSRYFVQESCTVIGGGVGGSPKQKKHHYKLVREWGSKLSSFGKEWYLSLFCYKQSLAFLYKCSISCKVNPTSLHCSVLSNNPCSFQNYFHPPKSKEVMQLLHWLKKLELDLVTNKFLFTRKTGLLVLQRRHNNL